MKSIIKDIYQYYNRFPKVEFWTSNVSWQIIKKELARVNINSMLITMPINSDSNLIFPFIVKDKEDSYQLVKKISKEGLIIDGNEVSFDEYDKDYSKELMLLEKAEYIQNVSWDIQKIVFKNQSVIAYLLILALIIFALLDSFDTITSILLSFGLLISIYTRAKEDGGRLDSPICINKGIFSCNKTKSYELFGIPFYNISIIYFLSALPSISFFGLTFWFLIVSAIGLCFCVYCLALQIFKEKKICILCMLIFITFLISAFWVVSSFEFPDFFILSDEVYTFLLFLLSGLFVTLHLSGHDNDINRRAHDFNMIMSEWPAISLLNKDHDHEIVDSNIIIGNNESANVIRLYIHTACKHCPEALKEMLNLILMNDDYCLHLYVRSDDRDIDNFHFNLIEKAVNGGNYDEVYNMYMNWKISQKIALSDFVQNENFQLHRGIVKNSKIDFYPTLLIGNKEISTFPRFENIKVSLMKK